MSVTDLYEVGDSGQQVVEGDPGLLQVGLGGAEGDAFPAPGARRRVGEGGRGAYSTHHPVPHFVAASHVHRGAPPQGHPAVAALVLPGQGDWSRWWSWREAEGFHMHNVDGRHLGWKRLLKKFRI